MFPAIRDLVREEIRRKGRRSSAPDISFEEKQVINDGESIYLREGWSWLTGVSAFYLSLPATSWGVVTHPDGSQHSPQGGLYEVPPGVYKLQYVDQHERHEYTDRVSEVTTDGEKLTLSMLLHYRVINPLVVCQIDRPVETLMANIETDLAQYIRTHAHNDIAESGDTREAGKIHQFFLDRHLKRNLLSRAFRINSVEIKDFTGDAEYFNMRRNQALQQRRDEIATEEFNRKREIERIHAEHNLEIDHLKAAAKAEMQALQGRILDETRTREIELERIRRKDERRHELLVGAITTIRQAIENAGYSHDSSEIKSIIDELLITIMTDAPIMDHKAKGQDQTGTAKYGEAKDTTPPLSTVEQKIKNLTNTLRNLLK
ncbi:MAG: hypothetical protein Q8L87_02390 [Anaerolineales bacterium]|jgi:hypothetical protein|nr:hypothetical protein [Anaerolineales bacterium]